MIYLIGVIRIMLLQFFLNGCIIIAILSLGSQIFINKTVTHSSPLKLKIFISSVGGLLGILLMINSVQVSPGVIIDFRNIAIMLSATFCGMGSAVFTALIIGLFRLLYTGLSYPSIVGAITSLIIGISCGIIARGMKFTAKQWLYMSVTCLILPTIGLWLSINNEFIFIKIIIPYWISTSTVSILVFFYVKYINMIKFAYKKYKMDSSIDHRTGLNNVRQFEIELNKIINEITKDSLITMLYIDIDFFKKVNDLYGHLNGDRVLADLGKILLYSTNYSDIVSRNGGEEFSVLMTDCPRDKVLEVAERLRETVENHKFYLIDGQKINIAVSIGVSIYPDTVNNINMLVEKADEALYQAKTTGRNKVVLIS